MKLDRLDILNVPVDALSMEECLNRVDLLIRENRKKCTILAVNPEKVLKINEDAFLKRMFDEAAILLPDGIGVVYAARLLHGRKIERVPGADLMQNICGEAPKRGWRIFIYGAKEDVNRDAVERLRERYEGIQIVGRQHGYLGPEGMDELVERINESQAQILFTALGSPKQEIWIEDHAEHLGVNVFMGIGGTLDTIVGTVKRAPERFQKLGLEWFYRLLKEPSRIKRQKVLPVFAAKVVQERLRRGMSPKPDAHSTESNKP